MMRRFIFTLLLVVGLPVVARAQSTEPHKFLMHTIIGSVGVSAFADTTASIYCIAANPQCREVGGLRRVVNRPIVFATIKGSVAMGQMAFLVKVHETHPKMALLLAAGFASYNFRLAKRAADYSHRR